jgi:hypothetical protein
MVNMHIALIGDIVGEPGRKAVRKLLPAFREERDIHFVAANAENAAGGSGITCDIMDDLLASGCDCLTMGDHVFRQRDIYPRLESDERILRPGNLQPETIGKGVGLLPASDGRLVGVMNLQGRTFMKPSACPYHEADRLLEKLGDTPAAILVDFHAEATSDKVIMGRYLDGRVSAVLGTHTHIATADECVLPGGTAYLTDVGMTGPYESIIGRKISKVVKAAVTGMPFAFDVATGDVRVSGALVTVDDDTGKATAIERFQLRNEAT